MTEDGIVGWHHWLDGREFEQTLEDSEGQRSLACYSSWGLKESDTALATERQRGGDLGICIYNSFPQARQLGTTGLTHHFGREPVLPCMTTALFVCPILKWRTLVTCTCSSTSYHQVHVVATDSGWSLSRPGVPSSWLTSPETFSCKSLLFAMYACSTVSDTLRWPHWFSNFWVN